MERRPTRWQESAATRQRAVPPVLCCVVKTAGWRQAADQGTAGWRQAADGTARWRVTGDFVIRWCLAS